MANYRKHILRFLSITLSTMLFAGSITLNTAAAQTEYNIASLTGKYKTLGRTELKDNLLMLDWSAGGIVFKAECSGDVKIKIDATRINTSDNQGCYFTVIVDGEMQYADLRVPDDTTDWTTNSTNYPFHITQKGEASFTIAEGLKSGEHTFEIYKQSEALYSAFGIKSITLNGTFLNPPEEKNTYIEFVGDSITAGYSNLVLGMGGQMLYEDATSGWPYLTAKALNADWSIIARTGITATKGIGHSGASSVSMPDVYPKNRYFSDSSTIYNFARQPDVIVVCLGTNDMSSYSKVEGATLDTVKQGFVDLLTMLRRYNPNSKIVWIYGMMTSSANNLIATAINESGGFKNGIYSLELPTETGGRHPGPENQVIYAEMLSEFISSNILNPSSNFPGGYNPELITPSASVLYYNFNEGEGVKVNTKSTISTYVPSSMDYSATLSENSEWVDGFVGNAVKFDSYSDTLTLNKTSGYNQNVLGMQATHSVFKGAAEYDFWVKFNTLPTAREQMLLCREGYNAVPWAIKVNTNGQLGFCWKNDWVYTSALDWSTNEWYHINITNSNQGVVTIKRDGITYANDTVTTDCVATNRLMYINGGLLYNESNYFDGIIDELYLGAIGGSEEIRLRSKVNFVTNNGTAVNPQYVYYGQTASKPDSNIRDWYTDPKCTKKYDFTSKVITDITLYSGYKRDIEVTPSASVLYYNFNEGEGLDVNTKSTISTYNSSTMDYGAVLSNSVEWVDGFVGNAVKFDSYSDTLTLNKTSGYNQNVLGMQATHSVFKGAAEYDFWVKFNTLPTAREQMLLCREGYNAIPWAIKVNTNGQLGFCWKNEWIYTSALDWSTSEWYHINITNSNQGVVTIKRDGIAYGSDTVASDCVGTNRLMYINGGLLYNESNYFDGVIDELYLGAIGGSDEIRLRSKISFKTNGAGSIAPQYKFTDETATEPTNPTKTGYSFKGWYTDASFTIEYDFTKLVSTDITLYAKWESNCILGDADSNGEITTEDMVILRQYLLGTLKTTIGDISVLDLTSDGKINLKDLVKYKKYFAGITDF